MTKSNLHYVVVPHGSDWAVRRNDGDGDSYVYESKEEARNRAIALAQDTGVNVLIYDAHGQIEDEVSLVENAAPNANRVDEESSLQGRINMANMTTDGLWDQVAGKWKQLKGDVQKRWGKLTDDQYDQIAGDRTKLEGQIQEAYGVTQQEASKQIDEWEHTLKF